MSVANMLHLQASSTSLVLAIPYKPPEKSRSWVSYISPLSETL